MTGSPMIEIVRARDLCRVPWKDGGGTTAEVATDPPGAGFDAFDWRVSLADVEREGPFSRFPGIDRTLILVEGRDLALEIDGVRHALAAPGDRLRFPGEAAVRPRLDGGPVRDLNVMTRRGVVTHTVGLGGAGEAPLVAEAADRVVVVALSEAVTVMAGGSAARLGRLDAAVVPGAGLEVSIAGRAVVVTLARVAA